jgi:AcrR family transcriptional regulator
MKHTDPREQVLRAALSIINQYGYGALCLSEVAKRLKSSKQRIYYHYPGTEEILLLLAQKWSESGQHYTLKALADSREEGPFRVLAMADGMFDWMEADPELAHAGLVFYQMSPHLKKLGKHMDIVISAGRSRIESLLRLDPRFAFVKKADIENIITALHSHIFGYFFYSIAMKKYNDVTESRQICLTSFRGLLQSLLAEL